MSIRTTPATQKRRENYMPKPIHYGVFQELFKELGINPYEFRVLSGDNVKGFFPDLPGRKPKVDINKLALVLWGEKGGKSGK